jgi:hypothetical protein
MGMIRGVLAMMKMISFVVAAGVPALGGVLAAGVPVLASAGDVVDRPGEPSQVVGGSYAETCEYPASVAMRTGGCSGTLIHPEIVLYAAHCGEASRTELGERSSSPAATVGTEYCRRYPNWDTNGSGTDIMFCKLQGAVNVPITPVIMGCEIDQLEAGDHVIPVGFGRETPGGPDTSGPSGRKKWVNAEIMGFPNGGKMIGIQGIDPNEGICHGDSGGSMYYQLDDGSWRMIGITSTGGGPCPSISQHVPTWRAVEFVESETGIDVTPCHDADGTWNPGPGCGNFPTDIPSGAGLSWSDGCVGGPVSGPSSTCGPPYGDPPDEVPPTVEITDPADGSEFDGPEASVEVTINVDGVDQWGARDVTFEVSNGADSQTSVLEKEPWDPGTLLLPEGQWVLTATVRDWSNNESSDVVTIGVGVPAPENPDDDGDDGSSDDGNTGGDGGDDGGDDGSDDGGTDVEGTDSGGGEGCGCIATPASAPPALLLLLALYRRRTRGSA